jgi:polysaccharide biosynthesis protein PslG
MRRRAVLAVGTLMAVLAFSGCAGGDEGDGLDDGHNNDPLYGVISAEPLPDGAMLARLGRGGVGTLRVNLAWAYVQAGPGQPYDWSHYDPVVRDAARNGVRVLATVYGSPGWVQPTPEIPPLGPSLLGFAAFTRAAVERYGRNGTFWSEHPDLPRVPITDWQLWNEPNFGLFWKPVPDPQQYLELLRPFHTAVKDADPGARVLLGGVFPTPRDDPTMETFLSELYRAGAARFFDVAAVHPYAATPEEAVHRVRDLRELMRRFGDAEEPIWITEVGWASGGAPSGLTVTPARQAAYLSQTFHLAADARDRLGIAGVIWYSLKDTPGPFWPGHCGLFELDGAPKPSWEALVEVTGEAT